MNTLTDEYQSPLNPLTSQANYKYANVKFHNTRTFKLSLSYLGSSMIKLLWVAIVVDTQKKMELTYQYHMRALGAKKLLQRSPGVTIPMAHSYLLAVTTQESISGGRFHSLKW
jgi:hypothetical protein